MKEIINNTTVTDLEVISWREEELSLIDAKHEVFSWQGEEASLIDAKHNAQVAKLLDELDHIRNSERTPDQKIAALIDIIIRGVQFRPLLVREK